MLDITARDLIDQIMVENGFELWGSGHYYQSLSRNRSSNKDPDMFSYYKADFASPEWISEFLYGGALHKCNDIKIAPKGVSKIKNFKTFPNNEHKLYYGKDVDQVIDLHDPDSVDKIMEYILNND